MVQMFLYKYWKDNYVN